MMRALLLIILAGCFVPLHAQRNSRMRDITTPIPTRFTPDNEGWQLVWHDEFDGNGSLDTSK